MEKRALMAKAYGHIRHPINRVAGDAAEAAFRKRKFEAINERLVRGLEKAKIDKATEGAARYIFFPKRGKSVLPDPIRKMGPKAFGKKTVEMMADNPELLPVAAAAPYAAPWLPAPTLAYLGAKSSLYKFMNVPTPGHMRHIRQRERMYDIAKDTGMGAGMIGAGMTARSKIKKRQKAKKMADRSIMYKAAADELRLMASL